MKDKSQVLYEHRSIFNHEEIFGESQKSSSFLNTLKSLVGIEYFEVIQKIVQSHRSHDMGWWDAIEDRETSMV